MKQLLSSWCTQLILTKLLYDCELSKQQFLHMLNEYLE